MLLAGPSRFAYPVGPRQSVDVYLRHFISTFTLSEDYRRPYRVSSDLHDSLVLFSSKDRGSIVFSSDLL